MSKQNCQNPDKQIFLRRMPTINYVLVSLVCIIMLPFAILSILKVAEVGTLYSAAPALDITAACLEFLSAVGLVMFTLLSRYIVTPQCIIFQRIIPIKIPMERLLILRFEASEKLLVLYYIDENAPDGVRFLVLQVFPDKIEQIVAAIQLVNPHVSYEIFDRRTQEKDE